MFTILTFSNKRAMLYPSHHPYDESVRVAGKHTSYNITECSQQLSIVVTYGTLELHKSKRLGTIYGKVVLSKESRRRP